MKPDQHKIKKNTAYKKKHGISSENSQASNSLTSKSESRVDNNLLKETRSSLRKEQSHQASADGQRLNDSSEDEVKKTSFSRRKIESNWQKYEIDIDAGEETLRGADFNELLQATRNVQPQFQFGKYHSVEEEPVTSESNADWLDQYVSLDLDRLAAAFQCIPLPQRLDINDSFFEESSLKVYREDAARQLTAYQKFINSQGMMIKSSNQPVVKTENQAFLAADNLVADLRVNGTRLKSDSDSDVVVNVVDSREVVEDDNTASELGFIQKTDEEYPVKNSCSDKVTLEITESIAVDVIKAIDILDQCGLNDSTNLPADVGPLSTVTVCTDTTINGGLPKKSIAELEDELDFLLAM